MKKPPGGQAATTSELENYPFWRGTTVSLMEAMSNHARDFGTEIIQDTVQQLDLLTQPKKIIGKKVSITLKRLFLLWVLNLECCVRLVKEAAWQRVSYCAT